MGQCTSNKSKQTFAIKQKKCRHPFLIIPYSRKEIKQQQKPPGDKPESKSSGVTTSFGFKRRVGSAPSEAVKAFEEDPMEVNDNEPRRALNSTAGNIAMNKFGFRSRSVSRPGSASTASSNIPTTLNKSVAAVTTTAPIQNVDNNKNVVENINRNLPTKLIAPSTVVRGTVSFRPTADSRATTDNSSPNTKSKLQNGSRNINRTGIPTPPISNNTTAIRTISNISATGLKPYSNSSKYISNTSTTNSQYSKQLQQQSQPNQQSQLQQRPRVTNKYLTKDKTTKQNFNMRVKTQQQSQISQPNLQRQTIRSTNVSATTTQQMRTNNISSLAAKSPRARKLEMVCQNNNKHKFELKEVNVEVTQVVPIKNKTNSSTVPSSGKTVYQTLCKPPSRLCFKPLQPQQISSSVPTKSDRPLSSLLSSSSSSCSSDEAEDSECDPIVKDLPEDKPLPTELINDFEGMEGSGDTMAMACEFEEEVEFEKEMEGNNGDNNMNGSPDHSLDVKSDLRSMLLNIEDPTFAVLAAMSSGDRLEDVNAPDSPSTSESTDLSPTRLKDRGNEQSFNNTTEEKDSNSTLKERSVPELESPGTPTNMSFSEGDGEGDGEGRGQDFLIDDEIADQPGLMFDEDHGGNTSSVTLNNKKLKNCSQTDGSSICCSSPARSVGTLSPCESITSEDLMLDFELSDAECTRLTESTRNIFIDSPAHESPNSVKNSFDECETTYVADDESSCTDSGYSFKSMENDLAEIKSDLILLVDTLSKENDPETLHNNNQSDSNVIGDLKKQILLLRKQCQDQERTTSLLKEELGSYMARMNGKLSETQLPKVHVSTQTERIRLGSLGYNSEGSDVSKGSLISSNEQIYTLCVVHPEDD